MRSQPAQIRQPKTMRHLQRKKPSTIASLLTFFGDDNELLAERLDFVLANERDNLTGIEVFQLVIMAFCLNIIVGAGVLPIGLIWFNRRRDRWSICAPM